MKSGRVGLIKIKQKSRGFVNFIKQIPSAIVGFLKRNKKKLIIAMTVIIATTTVISSIHYIPKWVRKPKAVEGSLFSQDAMSLLMCEWLEKPEGAIDEKCDEWFRESEHRFYSWLIRTEKIGQSFSYECYTAEYIGDDYINKVQNQFTQRSGKEFITGTKTDAFFSVMKNDFGKKETVQLDEKIYTSYEVLYSDYFNREMYNFSHSCILPIFLVDVFAMYPREMTILAYQTPDENGLYRISIKARVLYFGIEYSGEVPKQFMKFS